MASGTVYPNNPTTIVLSRGEIATITARDVGSKGDAFVYSMQGGQESVASASVPLGGSATVGPYTADMRVQVAPTAGALQFSTSPAAAKPSAGINLTQTSPATASFLSGDTTGAAGTNGTVTQVVAVNLSRTFIEIINNGAADVELWFGSKPADANVGAATKKGIVLAANGGGRQYYAPTFTGAIYATTATAGGLSVLEG